MAFLQPGRGRGRKYREIHVTAAVDKAIRAKEARNALLNYIQRNGKVALTTTSLTGILEQLPQYVQVSKRSCQVCATQRQYFFRSIFRIEQCDFKRFFIENVISKK
ncbi:hypothetical protein UYSO10_0639 [Kosakonia radicincitans]|uniref:Uncharacterized protein n=1 Tax=Kosakonia radicincitans TaxID=283686 RepID=A0AAX2EPV3_9ENTR|nr:hypothetical protein SAMN03159468_01274 [Kosakonia radicincitans]SFR07008.1 hypothetical protein SAMN03159514_01562 [Kosakonia radicincitans]SFT67241.1 hypothetical protein SAMN03159428_01556 [Kosakonia radicincitans]SFX44566.1 hypothetical protein SAMN03159436_01556 [Kosakonia radicincitans]VVT45899.1 hypothetical protein UYSO10_0639 [Kosakonia radicincitans]